MISAYLKKYYLILAVLTVNMLLSLWQPATAGHSLTNSLHFLTEVLLILPPVMILMGLLDAWIPRDLVEANLGPDAGLRGPAWAILLGTAAAGPLYAAFPIALSLLNKGARLANIVIFLGTWGAVKIPMIIIESSFIGLRFALLRLAFTVPCVLAIGYLMEQFIPTRALTPVTEIS
ncbi:MAG: permease [Geobacteraceae bacterium]|nr:permease [Geobacteraceae bacterium]